MKAIKNFTKEALNKRFVLLAEDDPRLSGQLEDQAKAVGVKEMVCAKTLEAVKNGVDDFVRRVEAGELDQTILTMIADLEYPAVKMGGVSARNGIEGIQYVRDAIAKYNLAHPDKPLQSEIILNTSTGIQLPTEAVSPGKKEAVNALLELIKKQSK